MVLFELKSISHFEDFFSKLAFFIICLHSLFWKLQKQRSAKRVNFEGYPTKCQYSVAHNTKILAISC